MSESPHDWLCRQIVDQSASANLFADREGLIRLWNHGAEETFDYPASEALGQPLDIIIPEPWRERHRVGYEAAMATGRTRYTRDVLAVPAQRRDGTRISIEFTIVLLHDDQDVVLGAAAIVQDVTQRWERDKALKQRLALLEGERKRTTSPLAPECSGRPGYRVMLPLCFMPECRIPDRTRGREPRQQLNPGNTLATRDLVRPGWAGPPPAMMLGLRSPSPSSERSDVSPGLPISAEEG
jgi:PAS domain S-box-containing protein